MPVGVFVNVLAGVLVAVLVVVATGVNVRHFGGFEPLGTQPAEDGPPVGRFAWTVKAESENKSAIPKASTANMRLCKTPRNSIIFFLTALTSCVL